MHTTEIETKDGEKISGPLAELNYKEYFIAISGTNIKKVMFSEIKSAKTLGQRISVKEIGDQDLLQKIRYELGRYYHKSEEEIRKILGES